jgi:PAS domain S-box-containing protein
LFNAALQRSILTTFALALAYYVAARLGLLLAFGSTNATPVWPASGIALAALLLLGVRAWPGVALGAFAANVVVFWSNGVLDSGAAVLTSASITIGNALEAIIGAFLLRRWLGSELALNKPERVYLFAAVAAGAASIAAVVGTTSLIVAGVAPTGSGMTIAATWWIGDLAGIALVTPLVLAWRGTSFANAGWRTIAGAIAGLVVLVAVLASVFGHPASKAGDANLLAYILLPGIGWAAYRFGMRGATLALVLVSTVAVIGTTNGRGPFARGTLNDSLFALEVFIGLCGMVGMVLAADVEGRAKRAKPGKMLSLDLLHWMTLYACLTVTIAAWQFVSNEIEQRASERFDYEVDNVKRRIGERVETYAQVLASGQAVFEASETVSRDDWRAFVDTIGVDRKYPGIQILGVARRVTDRAALERGVRAEGFPEFHVWPSGERDDYVPVVFAEPMAGANLRAFGFDLKSEPQRRSAMLRAMETGQLAITARVQLVQESTPGPQAGFVMFLPVYRKGMPLANWRERTAALDGYVFGAFRLKDLMAGIQGQHVRDVALEIFDGQGTSPEASMYAGDLNPGPAAGNYSGVTTIVAGDTRWTVRVTSLPGFETAVDRQKPLIVLFAGTLIGLLFFSMIRALTATREEALAQAIQISGRLRQSENRFSMLVNSASEFAIIGIDLDGTVNVFSVGAERMLGYSASEIVGGMTPFHLHVPEEVIARGVELSRELGRTVSGFEVFVARPRLKQAETHEWTYVRKDGATLPVQLTITPILDGAGEVAGFVAVGRDITEQKRAEHDLRDAMLQADAANRAKSEFVANMSHELRTPLNAVLGIAYLLARTPLSNEQRKDLDLIRSSGNALLVILNDILDFSKIEAGRMELSPAPFRIDDMLAALAAIMGISARHSDLVLTIEVDPTLPPVLVGDALRLQQVLVNLAGNAIKFTEQGQVAVRLINGGRAEGLLALRIEVEDSGIGMSQVELARLFSAFTQADSSMTRRFGGTGLGLTISRRLIDLMEGSIEVHSTPGVGSKFIIDVHMAVGVDDSPAPAPALLRVLAIDPHATSRRVLCDTIGAQGWECSDAVDLAAAMAPAAQGADLVLLDWEAAGADPAGAIRTLRQTAKAGVVLMVSSYNRDNTDFDPGMLGADEVLDKPVTGAPLRAAMQNVLTRRAGGHDVVDGDVGAIQVLMGSKLLLVEDNELNQVVARGMLEAAGAEVDIAGDGQQAVDMLRAHPALYHLVLLDIQMPVMDGFEAIRHIRGELGLKLPVLAMTAGVMERERDRCTAAGMNGFIAKPIDVQHMLAVIRRHLPLSMAGDAVFVPPAVTSGKGVFDLTPLIGNAAGKHAHLASMSGMIARLVGAGTLPVESAFTAWREGRTGEAAAAMHTLRGSIGSLGASRFADACMALEQALQSKDLAATEALFRPVRDELAATLAAAASWLTTLPQAAQRAAMPVPEEQLALFGRLLNERNLAACTLFEQFSGDLPMTVGEARAARISAAMQALDFDAAIAALDEV